MRRAFVISILALLAAAPLFLWGAAAGAHEIKPSVVEVVLGADGRFQIDMEMNAEAMLAEIGPGYDDTNDSPNAEIYDRYRAMNEAELTEAFRADAQRVMDDFALRFDGRVVVPELVSVEPQPAEDISVTRVTRIAAAGPIPPGSERFTWSYPEAYGPIALKMKREGDSEFRTWWLSDGTTEQSLPLEGLAPQRTAVAVVADYLWVGFIHIVPRGLDHILFVLGLFLLSQRMRPLLVQVTTFTVAHSITLALSLYGVVELHPSVVEPLIALSIAFVAIENIFTRHLTPWRPFVVFGFGLLHGLGFAGVLTDLGLARGEFLEALIGFNIGVEFGQLAVILVAWLAVGIWGLPERIYRRAVVIPASTAIALTGLYWTVERIGVI
ncbi:HupE/UreJ family protein [Minwuia thermotolerans]|uniref:HupE/UreJ family protein n=1 Tax=Minwuia thermotolerans TaxID=2056226 RepID=A0A2M9G265_9PROT|nr:HupE/UreJ family protein [Minwuia thermotolerans]PJK29808.1 hypothetical protein CVT23_08485 [Minwuia thermotolerans]